MLSQRIIAITFHSISTTGKSRDIGMKLFHTNISETTCADETIVLIMSLINKIIYLFLPSCNIKGVLLLWN